MFCICISLWALSIVMPMTLFVTSTRKRKMVVYPFLIHHHILISEVVATTGIEPVFHA